jgi:hypothetical protein
VNRFKHRHVLADICRACQTNRTGNLAATSDKYDRRKDSA